MTVVAGLCLIQASMACRDSTAPLWDLVDAADLVVVADVERVSPTGPAEGAGSLDMPPFTDMAARLSIRETWKGDAPASLVVPFNDFATWPAPPAYAEGSRIIALLRRSGGEWTTVGMSAGVIAATPATLEDLRQQVAQAVSLQGAVQVSEAHRMEWTVRSALEPSTRADGFSALVPGESPCPGAIPRPTLLARRPSREQLGRIAEAFVKEPASDQTLPDMLILLAGYSDRQVDLAAIHAVESALQQPGPPAWTRDALVLLAERLGETGLPEAVTGGGLVLSADERRNLLVELDAAAERIESDGEPVGATGATDPAASIDAP